MEKTRSIDSNAGERRGDYEFFFEGVQKPIIEQLFDLIEKIDAVLGPLGCRYRITTKNA